jgi:hypothetical protein
MNDEEGGSHVFKREIFRLHNGEQFMIVPGDKRIQKPVNNSVWHELDSLISTLSENCFVRGFGIGGICAAAFWTLYLW